MREQKPQPGPAYFQRCRVDCPLCGRAGFIPVGQVSSMILLIGSPIVAAIHTGRLINFTQEKARRQREEERLREVQEENARTRARIEQKKRDKPE